MTLFTSFANNYAQSIQATENLIFDLEQQLQEARESLASLQQQNQMMLTAQSAAENAVEMAAKARELVRYALGEEAVKELNAALVAESPKEPTPPTLPASKDDISDNKPTEPTAPTPTIIDVVAIVEPNIDTEPKEESAKKSENAYSAMSWKELQKFAASQGINPKGKKRTEIESLLNAKELPQSAINLAA